jgi:ankyrin repeat protein
VRVVQPTAIFHYTPLFRAVVSRNKEVVKMLLDHTTTNANMRSRQELYTPLMEAVLNRLTDIVDLFCASPKTDFDARNFRGETAAIVAAR